MYDGQNKMKNMCLLVKPFGIFQQNLRRCPQNCDFIHIYGLKICRREFL